MTPEVAMLIYDGLALIVLVVTLLPELDVTWWWVRAMDVPRVQIALVAFGLLAISPLFPDWPLLGMIAAGAALLWQAWKVHPYTPLKAKEVQLAQTGEDEVKFLAWNVLMENSDYQQARDLIDRESPDAILLMETDQSWLEALEPVLDQYETVVRHPKDNYYGLIFATRLPVREARVVYLTEDDTPTLFAHLETLEGTEFRFVGLHPRPPLPGTNSDFRDRQMLYAARFARKSTLPIVAMGDYNAAAWSRASRHFKQVGEFLDPRVGRGLKASFDARSRLLRCPIDQLYITPDIAVTGFHRGPHIGSDHFPMFATIRLDARLAARLNRAPPQMDHTTRAALAAALADYHEWLAERHAETGVDEMFRPPPLTRDNDAG
ncbi:endonuclease/exonuclease/phosphatase family protein [Pontibaca salina]|uniref:Endonuclease/exonuclease/phosphatase family protein n=1 Tax=Pontibaca salina TaxID=2795731 RepID=A0A934HJ17_9RHOB|nr:endonuclease/exonuclease/phosphatase family protein [Pontibaca salina]MBI6629074.1 endonuclease/exonuclease/phosphatase family protein [Pontibaca salina]